MSVARVRGDQSRRCSNWDRQCVVVLLLVVTADPVSISCVFSQPSKRASEANRLLVMMAVFSVNQTTRI